MTDPQLLNWVVQGGSFALVVAVMFYLGYVLIPKTIAAFSGQAEKFDRMLLRIETRTDTELAKRDERDERREKQHAAELSKRDERDERIAASLDHLTASQDRLSERITRLEVHTEAHDRRAAERVESLKGKPA